MSAASIPNVRSISALWVATLGIVASVFLVLLGGLLGLGNHRPAVALALLTLALLGYVQLVFRGGLLRDWPFWFTLFAMFAASWIKPLASTDLGFVVELAILAMFPLALLRLLPEIRHSASFRLLLVALCVVEIAGAASSWVARPHLLAALYSWVSHLKLFAMLAFGVCLRWSDTTERWFWRLIAWAWIPLLAMALFQVLLPGVFYSIFSFNLTRLSRMNHFFGALPAVNGGLHHPAMLANVCAMFALFATARALWTEGRSCVVAIPIYLGLMVLSGQRQESLVAFLVISLLMFLWYRPRATGQLLLTGSIVCGVLAGVLWLGFPDLVHEFLAGVGLTGYGRVDQARTVLYGDAVALANSRWPLGTGWGSFASEGAVRFDPRLFYQLGYPSFWWFGKEQFLLDSYWARYIAELGWIGFVAMIVAVLVMLAWAWHWVRVAPDQRTRAYAGMGMGGMLYGVLTSPTSFVMVEPMFGMLAFVFLGYAYQLYRTTSKPLIKGAAFDGRGEQEVLRCSSP